VDLGNIAMGGSVGLATVACVDGTETVSSWGCDTRSQPFLTAGATLPPRQCLIHRRPRITHRIFPASPRFMEPAAQQRSPNCPISLQENLPENFFYFGINILPVRNAFLVFWDGVPAATKTPATRGSVSAQTGTTARNRK